MTDRVTIRLSPTLSVWPDVIVGIGIAVVNMDAAREVWQAAREEHKFAA